MTAPGPEIGRSGLSVASGGTVTEEVLVDLQGRKAIEAFRRMRENDHIVGAVLFAIDSLIRQVEWTVVPNDEAADPDGDADFLASCMDDMSHSWADFISEALSMLVYGFAPHEIVYKRRSGPKTARRRRAAANAAGSRFNDGRIGWRKLPLRGQDTLDRWEWDDEGGLAAMVQKAPPDFADRRIPIEKMLLFRTSVYKNNPEGRSVLRNAYRPWKFKERIESIEGTGIERDLAGFPVLWVDPAILSADATPEEATIRQQFEQLGANIRRDKQEYLLMPNLRDAQGHRVYEIELLSAGGSRTFDTSAIIQRYNTAIAQTVLADFIVLGHEKVGSFALSSDKTDLFATAIGTYLKVIEEVVNRFAVPRLWEMNDWAPVNMPKIVAGDLEKPDLTALASFISTLGTAGVPFLPDVEIEKYLRRAAGLPEKAQDAIDAEEAQAAAFRAQQIAQANSTAEPVPAPPGAPPAPAVAPGDPNGPVGTPTGPAPAPAPAVAGTGLRPARPGVLPARP